MLPTSYTIAYRLCNHNFYSIRCVVIAYMIRTKHKNEDKLSKRYTSIITCVHEMVEKPCYRGTLVPGGLWLAHHNANSHHCNNANFRIPIKREAPGGAGWWRWWWWHTTMSLQRTYHVVYWLIGKSLKCNHNARCLTRIMAMVMRDYQNCWHLDILLFSINPLLPKVKHARCPCRCIMWLWLGYDDCYLSIANELDSQMSRWPFGIISRFEFYATYDVQWNKATKVAIS